MKEVKGIRSILVNDIEAGAVEAIERNLRYNELDVAKAIPNQGDANIVMSVLLFS